MIYKLKFLPQALKEWKKLHPTLRQHFKKKLVERLTEPRVESHRLSGFRDCYKIKLRSSGYRLVYQVFDRELCIVVIGVGKRESGQVYAVVKDRLA